MQKANYKNEIVKRNFFSFLKDSEGFADDSVKAFEKAILYWDDFSGGDDFSNFNEKQAKAFRGWIRIKNRKGTENHISLSYCYDTLRRLRRFFDWISRQPKSKINPTHTGFLNLSKKENRVATQSKQQIIPAFDEIMQVIESIKGNTEVEKRDRALICFILLTGARISATVSLPIKSFDKKRLIVEQDPAYGVKTKFSKRIVTTFFPLPNEKPLQYFLEWFEYLTEKGFTPNDPIFPATKLEQGKENINFYSSGIIEPLFWSNAGSARKIFEKRFTGAGIPYYHPHTLRHLIVKEFIKTRLTEEEKKAISQNLGHSDVQTTFGTYGYGQITEDRQADLVKSIKFGNPETQAVISGLGDDDLKRIAKMLKNEMDNSKE